MVRHLRQIVSHVRADLVQRLLETRGPRYPGRAMVTFREHALPHHHLQPGVDPEQVDLVRPHVAVLPEDFDPVRDIARHFHVAVVIPVRAVIPASLLVMQDDEIAHFFPLELALGIEALGMACELAAEGKKPHQANQGRGDQVNAGRLERLQETGRETQRDTVPVPGLLPAPGAEFELPRFSDRRTCQVLQQERTRLVVGTETAAVDDAVAGAMLQRDAPLPADGVRHRPCIRWRRLRALGLHRPGAVGGQPVPPVLVADTEHLADQQSAESRAVDEKVSRRRMRRPPAPATRCCPSAETTVDIREILPSTRLAPHRFALAAQVLRVRRGVEMVGVVHEVLPAWIANLPCLAAFHSRQ